MSIKTLDAAGLKAVLARAADERWTVLGLIGPTFDDYYVNKEPWFDAERTFRLPATVDVIAAGVTTLEHLRTLMLLSLGVGEAGARAIAERLTSLTTLGLDGNQIGEAGARAIAEGLTELTTLYLAGNRIGETGARAIAERLTRLKLLSLWGNHVGEAAARVIAERLPGLTTLSLGDNQIGEDGARAIAERLTSLTELYLWTNQIGEAGARVIAERLTGLRTLSLWGNQIGDAGARVIAERLTGLTTLNLGDNQIGEAGARAIAERLTSLTELYLWTNQIGEAGARVIAERLTRLTTLYLNNNQIGEAGARVIAERLTKLTELKLEGNQIGEAGARVIAERLTGLRTLSLNNNQIGEAGARVIAERLTKLTELRLEGNQIGEAGARIVAERLTGLATLAFDNNQIGEAGARVIAERLTGLTTLNLGDNQIGEAGARAIAERLTKLRELRLAGNQIGEAGARVIAERLTGLTTLNLNNNQIGEGGARAIAERLTGLTTLYLGGNQIGDAGARVIAERLTKLTELYLWTNQIGEAGARVIAERLTGLWKLGLDDNKIGEAGARVIAERLTGLTTLYLNDNQIGEAGARVVTERLTNLTELYLNDNQIGEAGARVVAERLTKLRELRLEGNQIGEAGARVIAERLTGLTMLYLNNNQIGEAGARAIAERLTKLTELRLERNQIGDAGARAIAERLTRLTTLYLNNNQIGEAGARVIAGHLTKLTELNLEGNQIGETGARAIAERLTSLTTLNLNNNQIGEAGARAIAERLTKLTELYLWTNQIGEAGARAIAEHLTSLTKLSLGNNHIGEAGARSLLGAWTADAARRRRILLLDLRLNGDLSGVLPREALNNTDAQAILAAYVAFGDARAARALVPLNEAKLLVLGNETVGKTSLVRYLIHDKPRNTHEPKTHKIEMQSWKPAGCDIRLNVWDFGGQEIMHGTHRYFLTERSLYLIVVQARTEDDKSIYEWLKVVRNRGGDSPVIVVINKAEPPHQLRLQETELQRDYPNIVRFVRTSCNDDAAAADSIAALRQVIVQTLRDDERLRHVREGIPPAWMRVKRALAERAKNARVLGTGEFQALCTQPTVADRDQTQIIAEEAEQTALLRLLHDLGVVVAHGLRRDARASMREITLLDPNWLTGAIYTLLTHAIIRDQNGEFARAQMCNLLDGREYPPARHDFILDMMEHRDFGLCFELPGTDHERYLLPEALSERGFDYSMWPAASLRFRIDYGLLPTGLIPRFIVQAHRNITDPPTRWRRGVILGAADCKILVRAEADPAKRHVHIWVDGPPQMRRAALNIVLDDLDVVHALNPEIGPKPMVPLPEQPEEAEPYEYLRALEDKYGPDYEYLPRGATRTYRVCELLDGVRREPRRGPNDRDESERRSHPSRTTHVLSSAERAAAQYEYVLRKSPETVNTDLSLLHAAATRLATADPEFPFADWFQTIGMDSWRKYLNEANINIRKGSRARRGNSSSVQEFDERE